MAYIAEEVEDAEVIVRRPLRWSATYADIIIFN